MKKFELSNKQNKNGRRPFKVILYEVYPDDCIINNTGTKYNGNGITWIKEYCESQLDSISGMSLTVEFINDERTEIAGHGDTGVDDGLPVFDNATMIGSFTKGYIENVEVQVDENTVETKIFCIAEGTIDEMRYKPFVDELETKINNGESIYGSVEIYKKDDNSGIVYLDGWKQKGRIPTIFNHSGFALLGIKPADTSATLLELNKKEEQEVMDEKQLQELINRVNETLVETNSKNNDYTAQISELNVQIEEKDNTISELNASVEQIQKALNDIEEERKGWWEEKEALVKALGEAKAAKRLSELNEALSDFTEDEQNYAKEEIDAFKEAPVETEINSIITKIYAEIGKKEKEEQVINEKNSAQDEENDVEDIFSEINEGADNEDDVSIF
ncbi:MAG TPA: hypothetical protein GXZ90_05990 [Clostridiales bacterium]|nr:hypothetical protein [Clostridiales bacterium]